MPQQLVTCTVEGGEGQNKLRRATVQLSNTATFGELLELARKKRYGALEFESPVYGCCGELDTLLRDTWVRSGCKIDGTLHIGLAVVVSFPTSSQKPLSLTMGPGDTISEVKQVGFQHPLRGLVCPNYKTRRILFLLSVGFWVFDPNITACTRIRPNFAGAIKHHSLLSFVRGAASRGSSLTTALFQVNKS